MHPDAGPARSDAGAYILAGGRSRRMGRAKHGLEWNGVTLVRRLASMAAPHVEQVWLVGKRDAGLEVHGLPVLYDDAADTALVHGIRTALASPGPRWRWLLACDMPDVDAGVLAELFRAAQAAGAPGCAPARGALAAVEPLPSLWRADAALGLRTFVVGAARAWVERAGLARWVVPEERQACLANLNTVEEWDAWRQRRDRERA